MTRKINTGAGDVETISTVYTSSADLTGVTPLQVAFGSYSGPPGAWQTPTATTTSQDGKSVTLSIAVGSGAYNPTAGTYWLWRKVGTDISVDPSTRYIIDTDSGVDIGTAVPWAVITDNGDGTFTVGSAS